ncbi:hypothetical protein BDW66DRAFT_136918 [Aspergillus desertorum]
MSNIHPQSSLLSTQSSDLISKLNKLNKLPEADCDIAYDEYQKTVPAAVLSTFSSGFAGFTCLTIVPLKLRGDPVVGLEER